MDEMFFGTCVRVCGEDLGSFYISIRGKKKYLPIIDLYIKDKQINLTHCGKVAFFDIKSFSLENILHLI